MSSPTLTFTPAMFHAAHVARIKTVTRRLAQVSRQNHIDQLAEAIANDAEMQFWTAHLHLAAHRPGETKPMVTSWAVNEALDDVKPCDLAAQGCDIWWNDGSEKPAWAGKIRPARFFPGSLYSLAPQCRIESARPEPLHAITIEDAIAEGCSPADSLLGTDDVAVYHAHERLFPAEKLSRPSLPIARYHVLWDTIHPDHPASSNPIVWRYQFTPL